MVGWYDPGQLINTGVQVVVSDLIGTRSDARREEALAAKGDEKLIDYSQEAASDFWFDYMADIGDGWDSAFRMATLVSQSAVSVGGNSLPRGRFLIFGGDEVYPTASKQNYQDRLIAPFEAAYRYDLYAIPGNHDWYDGLVSFLRQFCQQRRIGSWSTQQTRSYFALKLPYNWWLWAVDTQLENDLDRPQVEYFRSIVDKMNDGDRLIVCIPEPDWLYGKMQDDPTLMNNLEFLLGQWVLGQKKVKAYVTLAGDLHHYRRHQHISDVNQQKIVAGGGGAFLHPTHFNSKIDEVDVYGQKFRLIKETQFPKPKISFWLTFQNLIFPVLNPWFGILPGLIYLYFGWHFLHVEWSLSFLRILVVTTPPATLALVAIFYVGFFYFSEGERIFRALWGGIAHTTAHVAAVWWLADLANEWFGTDLTQARVAIYRLLFLLVGGYVFGSMIMGVYLLLSLNLFRRHHNEAFSALRIKHYKNFLRLKITPNGTLEIYPIGVPHLSRQPILIEGPIVISPT